MKKPTLAYSFQHNGQYFIFEVDSGKTLRKNIPTLRDCKAAFALEHKGQ